MAETEVRLLKCKIPQEELLTLGERLANLIKAVAVVKEDKKAANAGFKSRIDEIQKEISILAEKVDTGMGDRQVECYWTNNVPEAGMKSLSRTDSGEIVESKPMNLLDGSGLDATSDT